MNVLLKKLGLLVVMAAMSIASAFGVTYFRSAPQTKTGAAPQFTAAQPTTLYGSGIASSDTSIKLVKLITPAGERITTTELVGGASNVFYITVEPATTRKETISCTGVTQNSSDTTATLTGCTRGLTFTYPYTASTTLQISHSGGSAVVLSNSPQLYNDIITYVNSAIVSGSVDASPTAKGIVAIASAAQAAAHAQNGSGATTAYLDLSSNISSSTRTASTAQVVVASSTDGYIDLSYLNTTRIFTSPVFTGTTTMATSTTYFTNGIPLISIGKNYLVTTNTGTSTFTVPSGVNRVVVTICAGGGSSPGQASNVIGATGGAGGCAIRSVDLTGTSSVVYYVGAGGFWSTFGANGFYFSCTPGANGVGGSGNDGAAGGTCTNGDMNIAGGRGSPSLSVTGITSGGNQQAGASLFGGQGAWGSGTTQGVAIFNW